MLRRRDCENGTVRTNHNPRYRRRIDEIQIQLIKKEMNRYTYVPNPEKISKRVYMLKLNEGYEI